MSDQSPSGAAPSAAERPSARLEAFSDGVFAVAVTLLVVDLHVPDPATIETHGLFAALLRQWPSYLAYLTSFLTILVMWINHHNIFMRIRRVDHGFLVLTGLLLMAITLVPFPTSLVARYLGHRDQSQAAAIYAGTSLLIALLFNALWRYATWNDRLLDREIEASFVRALSGRYLIGPPCYALALAVSLVSAAASVGVCLALAIVFVLPVSAD